MLSQICGTPAGPWAWVKGSKFIHSFWLMGSPFTIYGIWMGNVHNGMSDKISSLEKLSNFKFPMQWLLDRLDRVPEMQSDSEGKC